MNHPIYNRANYPRLVWSQPDSNWHIYANAAGQCAAIAHKRGAQSSHFGDLQHVARCKRFDAVTYYRRVMAQPLDWLEQCAADPGPYMRRKHVAVIRRAIAAKKSGVTS